MGASASWSSIEDEWPSEDGTGRSAYASTGGAPNGCGPGAGRRAHRVPERRQRRSLVRPRPRPTFDPTRCRRRTPSRISPRRSMACDSTARMISCSVRTGAVRHRRAPFDGMHRRSRDLRARARRTRHAARGARPPTYPNGIGVEDDGSLVWSETYPGRVRGMRALDGAIEEVGMLSGSSPSADGLPSPTTAAFS